MNESFKNEILISKLNAGGIILNYKCTNKCRHCLVFGSPYREDKYLETQDAINIFEFLKKHSPFCEIHIGGGEPFLHPEKLISIVDLAINKYNINLNYVETNGFWGNNHNKYLPILAKLYEVGLRTILISVSIFHSEFISPKTTINAIKLATEIFSENGVFIWIPQYLNTILKFDINRPIKLSNFDLNELKKLASMYYLITGGRCGYSNPPILNKFKAKDFFISRCDYELLSTNHFHIDLYGNYMPGGLCSGISLCNYIELTNIIKLDNKPIVKLLLNEGIYGLYLFAKNLGYIEKEDGYVGKCHLCTDIRKFLFQHSLNHNTNYVELQPEEFYLTLINETTKIT